MSKIKIIKRNELSGQSVSLKTNEKELPPKSTERGTIETIENWIADWRKQTEIKTRLALGELTRIKIKNSIEI